MFYIKEQDDNIILSIVSPDQCRLTDIELTPEQATDLAIDLLTRCAKYNITWEPKTVLNDEGESKIAGKGHPQLIWNGNGKKVDSVFIK